MSPEIFKPSIPESKRKVIKPSGFEPFDGTAENQTGKLFVNLYGGAFSQEMELNRKAIEQALRLAHLDGKVFLSSLSLSRGRSFEANSDGSVSAKRSVFFGEKLEEEKDNPYVKLTSVPQGWKIEINEQRMLEDLMKREMDPKKRQKVFVDKFNGFLKDSVANCIVKEKLSSIKDGLFRIKLALSIFNPSMQFGIGFLFRSPNRSYQESFAFASLSTIFVFTMINLLRHVRKIDHPGELIMPFVEIDKVVEFAVYLNTVGHQLVREKP